MAIRKVSHHSRIVSKTLTSLSKVLPGQIIEFRYSGKDIYDKTPLVFILNKIGNVLTGINIGYMKEYKVEKLLEETNFKKLKYYSLYEDSFRTYVKSKIRYIKLVEYRTEKVKKAQNKLKRNQGRNDEAEF
tara:strand:+ start:170 stop:562 length:393 start_codon:yes stop_codon:yes gene_type:complete